MNWSFSTSPPVLESASTGSLFRRSTTSGAKRAFNCWASKHHSSGDQSKGIEMMALYNPWKEGAYCERTSKAVGCVGDVCQKNGIIRTVRGSESLHNFGHERHNSTEGAISMLRMSACNLQKCGHSRRDKLIGHGPIFTNTQASTSTLRDHSGAPSQKRHWSKSM